MLGKFEVLMRADCLEVDLPLLIPYLRGDPAAAAEAGELVRYEITRERENVNILKKRGQCAAC